MKKPNSLYMIYIEMYSLLPIPNVTFLLGMEIVKISARGVTYAKNGNGTFVLGHIYMK